MNLFWYTIGRKLICGKLRLFAVIFLPCSTILYPAVLPNTRDSESQRIITCDLQLRNSLFYQNCSTSYFSDTLD